MAEEETSSGGVRKPKYTTYEHTYNIHDDAKLTVTQDLEAEEVILRVEMYVNAYLALAFGSSLDRCDMVLLNSDEENPWLSDWHLEQEDSQRVDGS